MGTVVLVVVVVVVVIMAMMIILQMTMTTPTTMTHHQTKKDDDRGSHRTRGRDPLVRRLEHLHHVGLGVVLMIPEDPNAHLPHQFIPALSAHHHAYNQAGSIRSTLPARQG
jgi:Na+(H+)/acetate symporter ActP